MGKKLCALILSIGLLMVLSCSTTAEEAKTPAPVKHQYVGATKCKICHKASGVYDSWAATPHATAWDSLPDADKKKAELRQYYTTGTTATGELLMGVQCEACHGPGNDYKTKSIMEDREKAVANGLIIPDVNTCKTCHNAKAPAKLAALAKKLDTDLPKLMAKGVHVLPSKQKKTEGK